MGPIIYCGDTKPLTFTITKNGVPLNLTGITQATFLLKEKLEDADALAVVTKTLTSGSGITVTSGSSGIVSVAMNASDTIDQPSRNLYGTLKIKDASGSPITVLNDMFPLVKTAVRATF
jgi:hypothetical protein